MNSFYGGKQGNSFIIAKTYSTIAEMLESFGKNKSDCPVNFDEYVLINTVNKNNPENGQVFRRGYDYNSDRTIISYQPTYGEPNPYETIEVEANGAVYIGTIVGPAGPAGPAGRAPIFNFGHYKETQDATEVKKVDYSLISTKDRSLTQEPVEILNKKSFEELGLSEGRDFYSIVIKNISNGTRNAFYKYDKKADGKIDWYVITEKEKNNSPSTVPKSTIKYTQLTKLEDPSDENIIEQLNKINLVDLGFNEKDSKEKTSFILTVNEILVYRIGYFYYNNKHKLKNQNYLGWYEVDTPPAIGEDSFRPEVGKGLIPGVTYSYDENGKLEYDVDENGKRSIRKGINELGNTYQDTIDWTYCTVRNENLEDSTAYIGFRFGSPVIEFETESVSAYFRRNDTINEYGDDPKEDAPDEQKTNKFKNLNLIERLQTKEEIEAHPFYSKWKINIPKGIKGECIHNLRVVDAYSDVMAFDLDKDGNFRYNEIGKIQVKDYDGKQDDIDNQRKIIVFDYVCYDRIPEGEWHTIYLGDFNKIDGITVADDGTITLDYSHDDTVIYPKLIQWINDIVINDSYEGNQKLSIKYNNADNYVDIGSPLNYVIRMAVNPADGNLLALYSDPQKRQSGYEYDGVSGWTILGNLKYSKTLLSSTYDSLTPAERVSNLITGAVCYSIEEID